VWNPYYIEIGDFPIHYRLMYQSKTTLLQRFRIATGSSSDVSCRLVLALALFLPGALVQARTNLADLFQEAIEAREQALIEAQLEDQIEDALEENIQDEIEENVEEEIADNLEDTVQENIEDAIEDEVEQEIADTVEDVIEERIAENLEEAIAEGIADAVEENIEESIASAVEESLDESIESYAEQSVEDSIEDNILDSVIESIIDSTEEQLEARMNNSERHLSKHEWLVMAEEGALQALADSGYVFDKVTRLDGLGLQLAEVSAPASFDISEVRAGILDVIGSDLAQVDVNHLYTAGSPVASTDSGYAPQAVMDFPADTLAMPLRIGMIDTSVNSDHEAFAGTAIKSKHFGAHSGSNAPTFHGTAIASMLSANSDEYAGIAPSSELFAASVFETDRSRGDVASTASLVKALDWLTREQVEVINISLAGPPNRLLEAVLARVSQRGIPVLAAAGNAGPASEPLYPAAYESVVAITAVEASGRVFRLANRGEYLDLAAPGVNIRHANSEGGYRVSSGTSFAVPFASVAVARLRVQHPGGDALGKLYQAALDLGPPGKDSIYGYGLLNPQPQPQFASYQR
jgi:hypothetical protein